MNMMNGFLSRSSHSNEEFVLSIEEILDVKILPVQALIAATKKQSKAAAQLASALQRGEMRSTEKLRQNVTNSVAESAAVAEAITPIEFDSAEYLKPDGAFFEELLRAAEEIGVTLFERDGTVFCFPVLLRTDINDLQLKIDKSKFPAIRPSVVAKHLKALQQKEAKSKPEAFISLLAKAYPYVLGLANLPDGSDVKLSAIYGLLSLMPEIKSGYSPLDFTRDLYFLDISGIVQTKNLSMSLSASTATRESKDSLRFVDRDGREKVYSSVRFVKMQS
jgi:hypothetical protein